MILETRHPLYGKFPGNEASSEEGVLVVNRWYCRRKGADIVIWKEKDAPKEAGPQWALLPAFHHISQDLKTASCSLAWSIEAEQKAQGMLCGLIPEHLFKMYLLSGMFLETSKRSGVTYLFRRLRPTVALRPDLAGEEMRILAALCLHPIGYYEGTWAGAMTPTDDVLAHLLMMRGDEHMLWKRANQIPPWRPEAGL